MATTRKRHSADFKARVALEALKGQRTINDIAASYEIHPVQVQQWKKQITEKLPTLFDTKTEKTELQQEALVAQLYQQIGQLKVELDWLKKKI